MSDGDAQQAITVDRVLQHGLDARRIHAVYKELGGTGQEDEVVRYLKGCSGLPQLQRDLVGQAVDEELDRLDPREDAEGNRMASLRASGLLDSPATGQLERLPRMTQAYFDVMGAALTLITEDELITKSLIGIQVGALPREQTFCSQTIRFDRTLVVPDTHEDPRFRDNPYVTGPPFIRFYAGHPIQGPGDVRIGALCIIDDNPRTFSADDEHKLRTLAALVQLEVRNPAE